MRVNLQTIKELVEVETGIKDISRRKRSNDMVDARVLYYVLAKERAKASYTAMANFINKNHATALHSYKIIYESWKLFPVQNSSNLESLDRLLDIIDNDINELANSEDARKLFLKYKERNSLLKKENSLLKDRLEKLNKEVERLKKYEPIW